jgi:hypothetical protein
MSDTFLKKGDKVITNRKYKKLHGTTLQGIVKGTEYFGKYIIFEDGDEKTHKLKYTLLELNTDD